MIRLATQTDLPALALLEQQTFGDSAATVKLLLETFAGPGNIWLDEGADGPAAMALTVPVTLGGQPGFYLYALATRPSLRGTGRMTALLEHIKTAAREQGLAFLCLIPAGAELAAWYARRGFEPFFYRQAYKLPIKRDLLAVAEFDDVTITLLPKLRERFCRQPAVALQTAGLTAVLTDYYSNGGSTVRTDQGYGFFRKKDDLLLFDEFFAVDERAAAKLLAACREKTGCTQAVILTGDDGLHYYGGGRRTAYGMWCPLGPVPVREGYMGLMLDI